MLVSASFLSSQTIPETLRLLNDTDVDFIHVDVMDGKFVPHKTMPFKQMRHISTFTSKRLDVHLMVRKPSHFIEDYANLNTAYITIHHDIDEDVVACFQLIKSYAIKVGLAIKPETNIADIVPYLPYIDLLLVLGVHPGAGGQAFLESTVQKLDEIQQLLKEYPQFSILVSVDGGMNETTVKKIKGKMDIVVSGSYITNSVSYQKAINQLR